MKRSHIRSAAGILALSALLLGACGEDEAQRILAGADLDRPAAETTEAKPAAARAEDADSAAYEKGTVIRLSCAADGEQGSMRFAEDTVLDGVSYRSGDLRPEWQDVQERLGISIEDHYKGDSDSANFIRWQEKLENIDMLSVSAVEMTEAGEAGELVNLAEYLERMPHFKAFLEDNPIIRMSLSLSTDEDHAKAIYASPYLSDPGRIEKMAFMRADWVRSLLDGSGEFSAEMSGRTSLPVYQPFMPVEGKISIEVAKADGSGTETISKDYDRAGNIIAKMNEAGAMSGVDAVNMLRSYIDEAYNGYYGKTRSDLFLGVNAAWDADEMVALLRCVIANAATLNPEGNVTGLFTPQEDSNASRAGLYRLAGVLFGVRGLDSDGYLYFDGEGCLRDARCEQATYDAMLKLNEMNREGLISTFYVNAGQNVMNAPDPAMYKGFMSYADCDEQFCDTEGNADEAYSAVMIPVSRWNDRGECYMRFTESAGTVQPGGWAISVKGVEGDVNKLNACLALIDHMYEDTEKTEEGIYDSALHLGILRGISFDPEKDLWYSAIPSAFALTNSEDAELKKLGTLDEGFSLERVGNGENILINVILRGDTGTPDGEAAAAEYFSGRGGSRRLMILQAAWDGMRE